MRKNSLRAPAAVAQIDGPGLGQPGSMAEATTFEAPGIAPKRAHYKQRAGQAAQGAPDAIKTQHHRRCRTRPGNLQGQHATADTTGDHTQCEWSGQIPAFLTQRLENLSRAVGAGPAEAGMVGAVGPCVLTQKTLHGSFLNKRKRMTLRPARITVRTGGQVRNRCHRPGFGPSGHHPTIAGVIHRTDRGTLPAEHSTGGRGNRLAHGSARNPRIAVDLTLGVTAEVVAVDGKPVAVGQCPRASQHGLRLECGIR